MGLVPLSWRKIAEFLGQPEQAVLLLLRLRRQRRCDRIPDRAHLGHGICRCGQGPGPAGRACRCRTTSAAPTTASEASAQRAAPDQHQRGAAQGRRPLPQRTQIGGPRAIEYLKGRGLSGEIAARFGLGYAPAGWRSLASVFPSYDDPLLEESGMVIVAESDSTRKPIAKRYDRFRDRIMFPIRSVQGEVIGFGGRVLGQGEPKYLNSPETPVFVKGRELYGLYEARTAMRQRGFALVVEGYMDVVALAQSGFANAVATLGTACTAEHVQKLFRFTDSVVFSFDGDAAGRRAAARALEAALPHASDTAHHPLSVSAARARPRLVRPRARRGRHSSAASKPRPLSRQLLDECPGRLRPRPRRGQGALRRPWPGRCGPRCPTARCKRQLLREIASMGGLEAAELAELWRGQSAGARTGRTDLRRPADGGAAHAVRQPRSARLAGAAPPRAVRRAVRPTRRCACCCCTATGGTSCRRTTMNCCTAWRRRMAWSSAGSNASSPTTVR